MEPEYENDKLWMAIMAVSFRNSGLGVVALKDLKKILEKYKVLGDEKYGYIK